MKITEWIESVSNDYTTQHIDELNGVIIAQLNNLRKGLEWIVIDEEKAKVSELS